jgi:SSS family transporter
MSIERSSFEPPFLEYEGKTSFFGGEPPLPETVGYIVVIGFGALFSVITTLLVFMDKYFTGRTKAMTSEQFNTAGRMIKTGLTASVIISQWTWAATLLQSSNVAWQYGVSGPFWYASGATIQILLFGVLAIKLKQVAPSAHTMCEIVNARWGRTAHKTFLFFGFCANIIVTSMLLLGGAATVEALTGMDYRLASFLIPWGVILYTSAGGLKATFLASYIHTTVIFIVLMVMIFIVYIKVYSADSIYRFLDQTVSYTTEECEMIYSYENGTTFFDEDTYACGPVPGNYNGSYLTMISSGGLMFGIVNIVGNFGTVFLDQSYWQSAIAARPTSAAKGYLLGGIAWFAIPFSLATSLGLSSTALMLPITASEAGSGLVPPAVATHLLGEAGSVLILVMLFMAIVSTGSAESIAVSSLIAYDIYREYFNPNATGKQILFVSRIIIVVFGLLMGAFSLALYEMGLNLGWVYCFMGTVIGSGVAPLWFMMTWKKASGTGAVIATWAGFFLAVASWMGVAWTMGGELTVDTLGQSEAQVTGNIVALCSSALIHYIYSVCFDNVDYDFSELDKKINLVEDDRSGLGAEQQDPALLAKSYRWITVRGYILTFVLAILWPALSIPAGVFSEAYFAFWVMISIIWGFGAAGVIALLPLLESKEEIGAIFRGMRRKIGGVPDEPAKELSDDDTPDTEPPVKIAKMTTFDDEDSGGTPPVVEEKSYAPGDSDEEVEC